MDGKTRLSYPAALGLRVRRGYSYHGVSLNVDMDLSPFADVDSESDPPEERVDEVTKPEETDDMQTQYPLG